MNFRYNCINTGTIHTNTCAYRIYILVVRPYSHLGTVARLTSDILDLYDTVSDFRYFFFEEATNQIRMSTTNIDLQVMLVLLYFENKELVTIAGMIGLTRNLLTLGKDCLRLSQINAIRLTHLTLNNTSDNSMSISGIFILQDLMLFFTNTLHQNISCSRCSNTTKFLRIKLDIHGITKLIGTIHILCFVEGNLSLIILYIFNNSLGYDDMIFASFKIHENRDVLSVLVTLLACYFECILDFLQNKFLRNIFLLCETIQSFHKRTVCHFGIPPLIYKRLSDHR